MKTGIFVVLGSIFFSCATQQKIVTVDPAAEAQRLADRDSVIATIKCAAQDASSYFHRTREQNGGNDSFFGWLLPEVCADKPFASFNARVRDTVIILRGVWKRGDGGIQANILPDGSLTDWISWGGLR